MHPPGARLYLHVPDVQSVREAYARTALGKLLADPQLSSLAMALGGEQRDLGGALLALYTEQVEAGDLPPLVEVCLRPLRAASLSVTFDGGDLGELAAEMSAAELAGDDPWDRAAERLGVLIDLEFEDADAARRALELLATEAGVVEIEAVVEGEDPVKWEELTGLTLLNTCWYLSAQPA